MKQGELDEADTPHVTECLELACADSFVARLPFGLSSKIIENGNTLSAGQKQRLILARALFRRPRLLVLDEAMSNVDPLTKRQIMRNLLGKRCTIISAIHQVDENDSVDKQIDLAEHARGARIQN